MAPDITSSLRCPQPQQPQFSTYQPKPQLQPQFQSYQPKPQPQVPSYQLKSCCPVADLLSSWRASLQRGFTFAASLQRGSAFSASLHRGSTFATSLQRASAFSRQPPEWFRLSSVPSGRPPAQPHPSGRLPGVSCSSSTQSPGCLLRHPILQFPRHLSLCMLCILCMLEFVGQVDTLNSLSCSSDHSCTMFAVCQGT